MEALKTNLLIWRRFMYSSMKAATSSMKAAIRLGPNYLANLEVYKNRNFEEIQSLFNITQKLILEHPEEIFNVHTIEITSHSSTRSVLSHDQVIQWTQAKVRVYSDSVLCLWKDEWKQRCNYKMRRLSEWIQHVPFLQRICWESMDQQLNSSGIFSQDFRHCRIFKKIQDDLRERNIKLEDFTDLIIFMSMFNDVDWTRKGNDGICILNSVKVTDVREDILAGTLDVSGSWRWKEVVLELFLFYLKENEILQPLRWWYDAKKKPRSSSIQEYQCFESWNCEKEDMAETPYTSMRMLQTPSSCSESFILCKSAQYLRSSYELVWTIRLDRGRKGSKKNLLEEKNPWPKVYLTSVKSQEVKFLVSSPRPSVWKQFAGKHSGLRIADGDNSIHKSLRTWIVPAQGISWDEPQNSTWRGRRVWADHSIIPRTHALSRVNPQSRAFAAILGGTIIGPTIEVQIVKILDHYGLEIAIPSPNERERTSDVMISRGKSRFVDKVHIPNAELRSSAELLTELQKAEGGESCSGTVED